jgi:hypothetical protein
MTGMEWMAFIGGTIALVSVVALVWKLTHN